MTHSKELNERSPLRAFERSIHGGLGEGNLGVVCSGPGVGKTAFMVGVAIDHLMRDRQVLHIAADQPVDRVRNYYDEIFAEMARSENLEDAAQVRLRIERNRRIHTYQEHSFNVESLHTTLSFMRKHTELDPSIMILDGYDWENGSDAEIQELRKIAQEQTAELWLSAGTPRAWEAGGDEPFPPLIARFVSGLNVVVQLRTTNGTVNLRLLKDHDNPEPGSVAVDLDPTTLLLVKR
jgi:hypothetical protein